MKRVFKVCFITFALLLMVTPLVACGGAGAPSTPSTPRATGGNHPPVIVSLTPEAGTVIPGAETKISCDAADLENDVLTYTWTASAGNITEIYKTFIFWKAPDFTGEFTVSVTVEDGHGGSVAKSCTITVQTNQQPVISSLSAAPAELPREATSTVTCVASDPDGDKLTYTWTASGGIISGVGNTVTWKAPSFFGEFTIIVSISDGKGGITEGSCTISVPAPMATLTLEPRPTESGSIKDDGDVITAFKIGDVAPNIGVRPYFSFDIVEFTGAEIQEARLTFFVKGVVGNPWLISPFLYVDIVDYGPNPLPAASFNMPTLNVIEGFNSQPPGEIVVKTYLEEALQHHKSRFQVRLRLGNEKNFNTLADYIEFNRAELTVTYVK